MIFLLSMRTKIGESQLMITLYGFKNCDAVKKARRWLTEHGVAHRFHDFRSDGLDEKQLIDWVEQLGWEAVLNRRGTSWRTLSDVQREKIVDEASAIAAMLAHPALIKRPVLDTGDGVVRVCYAEADFSALLHHHLRTAARSM